MFNQQYYQGSGIGMKQAYGAPVTSQYQGIQKQFQPTGTVQSFYNPSASAAGWNQSQQSFHSAGYKGNQTGHDQYLRADSVQPSNVQTRTVGQQYGTVSANIGSYSNFQTAQWGYSNPQSFHTANYKGNQQGHDQYLRADAVQPSNVQKFQSGYGSTGFQSVSTNQYQTQFQNQYQSPQSFHTANYRGNQAAHDQYLRADSVQPSYTQSGYQSWK
ncbi:hypothetical protein [Ferviditalea candida]|uniref:Uncharacterized protein n=1 Tax=Ferviditalea candida TaxID=3108399 RepID=A0ABU5ZK92_9BACL|nr:hypothetical protein [Paenibacillaceae bacterium T2]